MQDPGLNLDCLSTSNAVMNNAVVLGSTACAEHVVQIQNSTVLLTEEELHPGRTE